MRRYNPKEIEPKWQNHWQESKIYQASEDPVKPKKYILEYFPYPSGAAMHVGHVRNYTIGDAMSRFSRMQGNNVLHPMGWDAFGLPAENYAIKSGVSPRQAIDENTARFKKQLIRMGFSYDWSREIDSTDPAYYKWTQWFFIMLFNKGLAYQKESLQWWCPVDKTVLANEQVENGHCWRCGSKVEKKSLKQWFFKITDYADRLEKDLDDVDWSESIKTMQRNWIGRSIGAEVDFEIDGLNEKIKVFTTRIDTLFGATFIVLAPEHSLIEKIVTEDQKQKINSYVEQSLSKSDIERQETEREKTGVFTGVYAINPATKKKIPVWVADYVLAGYGTGAIMAVPAHDQRDYEFAKKFELPIVEVVAENIVYTDKNAPRAEVETTEREAVDAIIKNQKGEYLLLVEKDNIHFVGGGIEPEDADPLDAVKREVAEETGYIDIASVRPVTQTIAAHGYRFTKNLNQKVLCKFYEVILNSEEKIPSEIEEGNHTIKWVNEDEVGKSITLKAHAAGWRQYINDETVYAGEGLLINSGEYNKQTTFESREKMTKVFGKERVNYKLRDWLISRQRYWGAPIPIIHCEKCGVVPVPEKDLPVVLPEVKSYEPSGDGRSPLANVPEFVNVDCPKCGGKAQRETDTMDGFACSSWYFLRFADPHNDKKPFSKELVERWLPVDDYIGGAEHAVMHLLYARFWTKVMFDEGLINFVEPFRSLRNHGMILAPDGQKMSKSKNNTIEPETLLDQGYGADSIRLMELFIGPWNQAVNWSVEGMGGTYRFLQRVWTITNEYLESEPRAEDHVAEVRLISATHKTIKKVSKDLEAMSFNTAIASLMGLVNELYKIKAEKGVVKTAAWKTTIETLLQLLAPFAPHIAEELWHELGHRESVHITNWPSWDEKLTAEATMTLAIQVNGKVRAEIEVDSDTTQEEIIKLAKENGKIAKLIAGQEIKKEIYVPGRLVSLVVV